MGDVRQVGRVAKAGVFVAALAIAVVPFGQFASPSAASAVTPGANGDIFFNSSAKDGQTLIWRMHANGTGAHPITAGDLQDDYPSVSADGKSVVFTANTGYSGDCGLVRIRTDGTHRVQLTRQLMDFDPSWAPDGHHIVFDRAYGYLFLMNGNGTHEHQIGRLRGGYPTYMPNGRRILFVRSVGNNVHPALGGFWTVRPDGTGLRQLTRNPLDIAPSISPDGRHIVFLREGPFFYYDIYKMHANGTRVTRLTPLGDRVDEWSPTWSPDGRHIAFQSERGYDESIWVMNPDGTHKVKLAGSPTGDGDPSWGKKP